MVWICFIEKVRVVYNAKWPIFFTIYFNYLTLGSSIIMTSRSWEREEVKDFVTTILTLVIKSVTMVGGCVKNFPKLCDVINGQPIPETLWINCSSFLNQSCYLGWKNRYQNKQDFVILIKCVRRNHWKYFSTKIQF